MGYFHNACTEVTGEREEEEKKEGWEHDSH